MPAKIAARRWIALPFVLVGLLFFAAPASAAFSLSGLVAAPDNTQAGAHPNFHVHVGITGNEDIDSVTTELPPGLVGNPLAPGLAYCTEAALNANNCLPASQVGTTASNVTISNGPFSAPPQDVNGKVFNVIPRAGEPGRLGIVLQAELAPGVPLADPIVLQGAITTRPDFGLNTTIGGIPNSVVLKAPLLGGLIPAGVTANTHINSFDFTLSSKFMQNPTSCALATTGFDATSKSGTQAPHGTASFTPTNCAGEAYNPHLGVTIDMSKDAAHILNPDLTTEITQGLNEANSKRVEAILPNTVQANNEALNHQCPPSSFPLDPSLPQTCPANTQVGTAVAKTPLLAQPLVGNVYLIQNVGLLPKVGLDLKGQLPARIIGNATPTADLRLDNVFGDTPPGLPDVPLSDFKLTFGGGPGGLIVATEGVCKGPSQYNAVFDSFGGQHLTQASNAKVIGCGFAKRLSKNRCDHKKLTDVGTKHADTIRGTKKRDVINGLRGNDKIVGLKGNDLLCGGKGKDKISGGPGKDHLFGGSGKDRLIGGGGRDKLAGGPGKDKQKQ